MKEDKLMSLNKQIHGKLYQSYQLYYMINIIILLYDYIKYIVIVLIRINFNHRYKIY